MKVICDQSALAETLGIIGSVIANRTPNPVLTCIRLSAEDGRLTMAATDGDCSLRMVMEQVQVDDPGETLVPADKLNQIVRECPDATVTLENDKQALFIRSGESMFKIYGFDPAEAPPIEAFDQDGVDCEITAGDLVVLINRSLFAAADEHSRYAINGVLVERTFYCRGQTGQQLLLGAYQALQKEIDQGALAAARAADDRDDFARLDRDRHAP